jgi:hypothetical protein
MPVIRVTVELISARTGRTSVLGVAHISNDGTGTEHVGHYDVALSKFGGKGVWKRGRVEGFARKSLGSWDLLFRALARLVAYRSKAADAEAHAIADLDDAPDAPGLPGVR